MSHLRPGQLLTDHGSPHPAPAPRPGTPGPELPLRGHGLFACLLRELTFSATQIKSNRARALLIWKIYMEVAGGRGCSGCPPASLHPWASRSSSQSLSFLTHKTKSVQCREIARSLGREPLGRKGLLPLSLSRQIHLPVPSLAARIKRGNNRSGHFENCQRERERMSKHLLSAYCVLCPSFIYFNAHMNPFR